MTVLTLVIDGKDVAGTSGQSILDVAEENGISIPTLCHMEGLSEIGACRLCMVEIEGQRKLFPACVTDIEEGMQVVTASERLIGFRRQVIELLFQERNHVCSVCVADTHFELMSLHPVATIDATHERFVVDHNRCILCTRCVRVCDEIEGAHTWDVMGRGTDARLITDLGVPWGQSTTCTSCGKCIQVCPTGALMEKGRSVAEAKRRRPYVPYLVARNGRSS
jgi:bidirectional [NiFe] hydrogenase diaphorase subunit